MFPALGERKRQRQKITSFYAYLLHFSVSLFECFFLLWIIPRYSFSVALAWPFLPFLLFLPSFPFLPFLLLPFFSFNFFLFLLSLLNSLTKFLLIMDLSESRKLNLYVCLNEEILNTEKTSKQTHRNGTKPSANWSLVCKSWSDPK